jgi:hypothetical protein
VATATAPAPTTTPTSDEPLAQLRVRPSNAHLFKGFGPLVAALILFLAMLLLAPSVAPEHVIEKSETDTSPTTVAPEEPAPSASTTVAPGASTTVAP